MIKSIFSFLAKGLSHLVSKPVITGRAFTTDDVVMQNHEVKKPVRKPGMAKYRASSSIHFIIVGNYLENGREVIRLYDTAEKKIHSVEIDLFYRLFKLV